MKRNGIAVINRRGITTVLLCALCLAACAAMSLRPSSSHAVASQPPRNDPKRVYLVHADELRYDRFRNNDAQVLTGSVQFEHEGARLYCDSANFFEATNSFEAWGHVRMVQGDTLSLTSDQGYYDGNQQMMEDRAYHDLIWMLALVVVQTLAILVMMRITTHLGVNPVLRAVDHIKKDQKIPIVGAAEFRYLASTYNTMYNAYKKSIESLNYKASHDELTGVYNRAGYDLIRSSLDMKTTAMLLFDADVFKSVNDHFGHETGDRVLQRIATALKSNFRSDDYVCRIGGDEFVVFIVHISQEPVELIKHKVTQINQDLSVESDGVPPISLSVGVSYNLEGNDPDEMFRQADTALYHVKENGRNGCCFYTDI